MFKNLTIFRVALPDGVDFTAVEAALQGGTFSPCGATQDLSVGWVPPREENGALIESVGGEWITAFMVETKSVPGTAVTKKANEAAAQIEATVGRKPGRKEMKQLKEDARQALLPTAHPKQTRINVWLDHKCGRMLIDSVSQPKIDSLVSALVQAFPRLELSLLNTQITPQTAMTGWLSTSDPSDWPAGFSVERECELKSSDEEKSVVRYSRHHLLNDEVRQHLQQGKRPTRLAMSWEGRVAFILTENLQLRKLTFLDGVFDDAADKEEDSFDADVAISTGELHKLLPALLDGLGGELLPGDFPADQGMTQ